MVKDGHLHPICGTTDFNRSLANKSMIELESRVQWCACPQETFFVDPDKLQSDLKDNNQNTLSTIINSSVHILLHDIIQGEIPVKFSVIVLSPNVFGATMGIK